MGDLERRRVWEIELSTGLKSATVSVMQMRLDAAEGLARTVASDRYAGVDVDEWELTGARLVITDVVIDPADLQPCDPDAEIAAVRSGGRG